MSVCWRVLGVEGSQKLNTVDKKFYAGPSPQTINVEYLLNNEDVN